MEPKSGKLFKLGHGIFGPKWTEKWVHLDGHTLKYFAMAAESQPFFSLSSARQSRTVDLRSYLFTLSDDKRLARKHVFSLTPYSKGAKIYTFACASASELDEWRVAFNGRRNLNESEPISPLIEEKLRRTSEAFTMLDPRRSDMIDSTKLPVLLQAAGWHGDVSQFSEIQQQLDPLLEGKISRAQFMSTMRRYFCDFEQSDTTWLVTEPNSKQIEASVRQPESTVAAIDNNGDDSLRDTIYAQAATLLTSTLDEVRDACNVQWNQIYLEIASRRHHSCEQNMSAGLEMATLLKKFREAAQAAFVSVMNAHLQSRNSPQVKTPITFTFGQVENLHLHRFGSLNVIFASLERDNHKMFGHQVRSARTLTISLESTWQRRGNEPADPHIPVIVPLQCTVDYLGFRGLVMASDGIKFPDTLSEPDCTTVSGSADQLLEEALKDCGFAVNALFPDGSNSLLALQVSSSVVGAHDTLLIQHIGSLFPTIHSNDSQEQIHHKLRPEFVRQHHDKFPFHSGVFNRSELPTSVSDILREILISAEQYLIEVIIPAFVTDVETNRSDVNDSASLTSALHEEGINMRYLGHCYDVARLPHVQRMLFVEMVARACKAEIREMLRTEEAAEIIVEFSKLVLGLPQPDSTSIWKQRVLPRMTAMFFHHRVAPWTVHEIATTNFMYAPQLLQAMGHHLNLQLQNESNQFAAQVESLIANTSPQATLHQRTTVTCEERLAEAGCFDIATTESAMEQTLAWMKFHMSILDVCPHHAWNTPLSQLLSSAAIACVRLNRNEEAVNLAQAAIDVAPSHHILRTKAQVVLAEVLAAVHLSSCWTDAERLLTDADGNAQFHLGKSHPVRYEIYQAKAEIALQCAKADVATQATEESVCIVQACFGRKSLQFADSQHRYGELLCSIQQSQKSIVVLEDAITVYEGFLPSDTESVAIKKSIASCFYLIAVAQANVDADTTTEAAYNAAMQAYRIREKVLSSDDPQFVETLVQVGMLAKANGDQTRSLQCLRRAMPALRPPDNQNLQAELIRRIVQVIVRLSLASLAPEQSNVRAMMFRARRWLTTRWIVTVDCLNGL
ncbi:hypothetical protein PINS_up009138 [Pythium insidiosum]|nr:hypothetical protein PINS_up009138 [Pythium insidiosum]